MTAAGLGTRWEAAEAGIVLLGTPTLQEDGAGRISLGVTPQGERLGCPHCRAPALPPGRGRARLPFIRGKNLPKRSIRD